MINVIKKQKSDKNVLLDKISKPIPTPIGNKANQELSVSPQLEKSISAYVPEVVLKKLQVGQNEWIGELRVVTIAFVSIHKDCMKNLDLMNHSVMTIQSAMYRHEGQMNKIIFDDKGLVCLCAMGLEVAHRDDPVRAVIAALYIKEKLQQLNIASSIGVTTGRIFCGSYGNNIRHDYSVIGETVNLASRLMTAASDCIFCDENTWEQSKEKINYDNAAQNIHVKGLDSEITVYKPLKYVDMGHHNHLVNTTTFIGRSKEKSMVAELLHKVKIKESPSRILILQGEGNRILYH